MIDRALARSTAAGVLCAFFSIALTSFAAAGEADPKALTWHVDVVPTQDRDVVEVVFRADIAAGWILYSSDFAVEIGPRPAKFTFDANPSLSCWARWKPCARSERRTARSAGVCVLRRQRRVPPESASHRAGENAYRPHRRPDVLRTERPVRAVSRDLQHSFAVAISAASDPYPPPLSFCTLCILGAASSVHLRRAANARGVPARTHEQCFARKS